MSLLLLLTSCLPVLTSARVNVMLIGATGNLANKYLLPAFFDKMITDDSLYLIPAATRDEKAGQEFIDKALANMACVPDLENNKLGTCDEQKARVKKNVAPYKQIDVSNEEHWKGLAKLISSNDAGKKQMRGNAEKKAATADEETGRLIYLAIPPHFVAESSDFISKHLRPPTGEHPGEGAWLRVVIEKPFGLNQKEAVETADYIYERLSKHEVYRNDHILSKRGLKAIRDLHTLNPGFEDRLHRDELLRVEVGMYDKEDVSDDPIYYNEYGVIRDVMQSHVTELAVAVAMFSDPDPPEKKSHRETKSETLEHMRAGESNQHYVAQYAGYNDQVHSSRSEEEKVNKTGVSQTPTYAFVTMYFNHSDRWRDVPFMLTAGKRMPENKAFVRYVFKDQAYIEIIVDDDDGGAKIKISEGPHFSADEIKGWEEWHDLGDNDHSPVERVLMLKERHGDDNPYTSVLENVLKGDGTKFVDDDDLAQSWTVWTSVLGEIDAAYGGNHSATLPVYYDGHITEAEGTPISAIDPEEPGHELTSHDLADMRFMIVNMFPKGNFGEGQEEEEEEYDEESMYGHEGPHEDL